MKHELSTQDRQWLAALKVGFDNEAFPSDTPHTLAPSDQGGESPSPPLSVEETFALLGASVTIDYPRMLAIEKTDCIMAQRRAYQLAQKLDEVLRSNPMAESRHLKEQLAQVEGGLAFWRYAAIAAGLVACCTIVAFVMLVRAINHG